MLGVAQAVLAVLAGVLAFGLVDFIAKWWKLRKFPGSIPLPFVGNLYDPRAIQA